MNIFPGKITFSPTDLVRFFESKFSSYMDHFEKMVSDKTLKELEAHRDPPDPFYDLIKDMGNQHEEELIHKMEKESMVFKVKKDTRKLALEQTYKAMQRGEEKIYQAAIQKENLFGYADLLIKKSGASLLGNYYYIPYDFKIARHPKPQALVQLCCYCDILQSLQQVLPPKFAVVTKDEKEHFFKTTDFFYFYLFLKKEFLLYHSQVSPHSIPIPNKTNQHRDWSVFAKKRLNQLDDISLTAGIRSSQCAILKREGVHTLLKLARLNKKPSITGIPGAILKNLKHQAKIQLNSKGKNQPDFEVLSHIEGRKGLKVLPPPHTADVFFDIEGYPLLGTDGLEYLYGNTIHEDPGFIYFLALSKQEEALTFQKWMDWVFIRWKKNPGMHIYHYGHYEPTTLKKLMGKYGLREQEMDNLLRGQVFVDLYRIVTQGLKVGVFSYSLKEVEKLYSQKRGTEVKTGEESIVWFFDFLQSSDNKENSPILEKIKKYNQEDCVSTKKLCEFLWKQQEIHNIKYFTAEEEEQKQEEYSRAGIKGECEKKATALLSQKNDIAQLLANLLMFHIREDKPEWWDYFSRRDKTEEEGLEDGNTIAFCQVVEFNKEFYKIRFEKEQEIHFKEEDKVIVLFKEKEKEDIRNTYTLHKLDLIKGVLWLKADKEARIPLDKYFTLGPAKNDFYKLNLFKSLLKTANDFSPHSSYFGLKKCIHDLLLRKKPDLPDHQGPLILEQISNLILNLNHSVFCIQGPPGTGKTRTATQIILHLIKAGKRIGVTANSHKAISNVLKTLIEQNQEKLCFQCQKVKSSTESEEEQVFFKNLPVELVRNNQVRPSAQVVGGTTFFFSKEEQESAYDYLFVDEASQVSLANLIAGARASQNIVLIGDQSQLDQPLRARHPGNSGDSALTYYTEGRATISQDKGVFLPISYRMHPCICKFISNHFYNEKLTTHSSCNRQKILFPNKLKQSFSLQIPEAGIGFVPVEHSGNTHSSIEEAKAIGKLYKQLLRAKWVNREGETLPITPKDILIVAPYNVQVACIKQELGDPLARVASVDKFQGQEAPVCILSLTASTIQDAPRGISFLLNKNRLNVALSRARCLSLVVGSKNIATTHTRSIPNMELMNIFCHLCFLLNVNFLCRHFPG